MPSNRPAAAKPATAGAVRDPLAVRSPFLVERFSRYALRYIARNFHALRLAEGGSLDHAAGRPLIVYTNHPSWWDPMVFVALAHLKLPGRRSFGPIDADALRKYRFFERLGMFGIESGRASGTRRFLDAGTRILQQADAALWVTAEGEFADPRRRPLRLRRGIAALAAEREDIVLVPLAVEYAFWNERFPEALCRFGSAIRAEDFSGRTADDVTALLSDRLTETMDRLASDCISRDPKRFDCLVGGRAGIGGTYDLWRRVRAIARGERFSAAHDDRRDRP